MYELTNEPRDYAWGTPGGISRALGRSVVPDRPEAELWLGAHRGSPAGLIDAPWPDLPAWEASTGRSMPYLLKLLAAAKPLSLQAHPDVQRAAEGFAAEEALGIPLEARERSYKDPHPKPELIVAVEDDFEALCGFRPIAESRPDVERLRALADHPRGFERWLELLDGPDPLHSAVTWLLSDDLAAWSVRNDLARTAARDLDHFDLVVGLSEHYPGDAGVAVALLLNHVVLDAGQCLWLPAGNIHAYVRGLGVELMGPSDNVVRGGLTRKHIDVPELLSILDFTPGPPPLLEAEEEGAHVLVYRPVPDAAHPHIPFELREIHGDAECTVVDPAVLLGLEGRFSVSTAIDEHDLGQGDALFVPDARELRLRGAGRAFVASAR